jgi:DNA-binding CsgD family transcriptional regulator
MRYVPGFESLGEDLLAMARVREADALGSRRLYVLDVVDRIMAAIDKPTLLNFEDLQWADEISLEIVGELARRGRDLPLLLVGAYRTEDLPPGAFFRQWRSRLIGQRLAEEVRLGPLSYEQTALMTTLILDTGLPAPREVVQAVYQRTDGIPLHVEELLGALGEAARSDGRAIRDSVVPETIEDAIRVRIDQLSPDAREVAQAGAVIGRCFIPEVLAGILDRSVDSLDGPITELIDRSYLYDAGDPGFIDFRHQLLRDVLYRSVRPSELRRLHARAGEFGATLEGQSEIHSSVHFERAGMRDEAYRTALAGARAASRMSGRQEAYDLYRRAIDNMPDDLPVGEQAALYAEFGGAAGAIERNEDSLAATKRARERYLSAGMPLEAADQLTSLANYEARDGGPISRSLALVEQALAEVEGLPETPEQRQYRGWFHSVRAFLELDAVRLEAAAADAAEAIALSESVGDRETTLEGRLTAARIEIISGRQEAGLAAGIEAAREARDAGYEAVSVTGYRNLAIAAARVMDYAAAETAIGEGLRYADAIEQSHCRQMMAATSGLMAWCDGRWSEADLIARQELAERGCRRGVLGALEVAGLVAMGRGDVDEARRWLDESLAAGRATGEIHFTMPALWASAELDLIGGDPRAATVRCTEALELAVASGERALLVPFIVPGARAWIAIQRPDEAERWLDAVRDHLAGWDSVAAPALAHATGLVRMAAGSLAAARDAFESAATGWTDRHRIWEATWARLDLAQALLRSNRHGEAGLLLAAIRATATELASKPIVARIDELARVARGRGAVDEPWYPLTVREFEVARLIAEGRTNGEIADQLDIAPKTASSHVEHILAKLDVTRRAEIAAWAATVARPMAAQAAAVPGPRPG